MAIVALIGEATTLRGTPNFWVCARQQEQMQVDLLLYFALATGVLSGADDSSAAIGMHVSKPCTSPVAPDT